MRSATEMELALYARLPRGEGRPADTLEQLLAADVLPPGFGRQADGSNLELTAAGPIDSLRVRVAPSCQSPTCRSIASRRARRGNIKNSWQPPPSGARPIRCCWASGNRPSKRTGLEHVAIDLQAAPLTAKHQEFLNRWLGPPAAQQLAPVMGNLISIEAAVRGGGKVQAGDHFLFFGLQDLLGGELPVDNRPVLERCAC